MISYIFIGPGGVVTGGGYAPQCPENALELQSGERPDSYFGLYLVEGIFTVRPPSPAPDEIEGGWRIAACPDGTLIGVHDEISGEALFIDAVAGDFDFTLPDGGRYAVEVSAPIPALPVRTIIEVPDA